MANDPADVTSDDPVVTLRHIHMIEIGGRHVCTKGARKIAAQVGLSWDRFLTEGYPASVMEATDNAYCRRAAAMARRELTSGR